LLGKKDRAILTNISAEVMLSDHLEILHISGVTKQKKLMKVSSCDVSLVYQSVARIVDS
jgi:hypothetical protein